MNVAGDVRGKTAERGLCIVAPSRLEARRTPVAGGLKARCRLKVCPTSRRSRNETEVPYFSGSCGANKRFPLFADEMGGADAPEMVLDSGS